MVFSIKFIILRKKFVEGHLRVIYYLNLELRGRNTIQGALKGSTRLGEDRCPGVWDRLPDRLVVCGTVEIVMF